MASLRIRTGLGGRWCTRHQRIEVVHGHRSLAVFDLMHHASDGVVDRRRHTMGLAAVADIPVEKIDLRPTAPFDGLQARGFDAPVLETDQASISWAGVCYGRRSFFWRENALDDLWRRRPKGPFLREHRRMHTGCSLHRS